jgi:inhibitor of the pro-sigma K processing machinery
MALLGIVILVLVIIIFLAIAYYVVKNVTQLVINAIIGLITLFLVNFFHLMHLVGRPDIGFNWITVLICALAGFPGALLLIVLSLVGITL